MRLSRVGGRLTYDNLPYDNKHPVILPSKHILLDGIIWVFQRRYLHLGADMILTQLRQHFWVIRGTEAVIRIGIQCEVERKEREKTSHL